jgi:hypothetical protein
VVPFDADGAGGGDALLRAHQPRDLIEDDLGIASERRSAAMQGYSDFKLAVVRGE